VLLFDELGNSMDDLTIQLLIDRLKPYLVDRTLILVTHKALLLNLVDRLIIMDNGHLIADGPRDEILRQLSENKIRATSHATNK
jgi:ATP-binding cassette subfamily C protein LapB